jgi:hypothetical protein
LEEGELEKIVAFSLAKGKRLTLEDGGFLEGVNHSWASLSHTCMRIEMYVM